MKLLITGLFVASCSSLLMGCCSIPTETANIIVRNKESSHRFIRFMELGLTTRQEEQDFIRANSHAWDSVEYATSASEAAITSE